MACCPHCRAPISFVRSFGAAPAFPSICGVCGGGFHSTGTLGAIIIALAGLVLGLTTVVLSGQDWLGGAVIVATLVCIVILARKSTLVPSRPSVILRWRLAIIVLLVVAVALELLPGGLLR